MGSTNITVIQAYRQLYRAGLRAIDYSTPARYTLVARLRRGFRKSLPQDFDPIRIRNTLQFLDNAATPRMITGKNTLEHRVLRTLLHTWYWQDLVIKNPLQVRRFRYGAGLDAGKIERKIRAKTFDGFDYMVKMLNESMGLCIR